MSVFEQWGRLGNDECARNARDTNNRTIQDYTLFTQYAQPEPTCPENKIRVPASMLEHPNLRSKVGFGTPDSCAISADPTANVPVRQRCRQQLFSRVFQAVPSLRPGNPDPAQEAKIVQGMDTTAIGCTGKREITERTYDVFVPLIPTVQNTIQNPNNLVEPWTRGGDHTREYIHTDAFKKTCRQGR